MSNYPFQAHKKLLSMGLSRLEMQDWLEVDEKLVEQIGVKQGLYQNDPSSVYQYLPSSINAQLELSQALFAYLPQRYPSLYSARKSGVLCRFNDTLLETREDEKTLLLASWAVQEDLCLLERQNSGAYILTAASLCAPSYWRLMEKIGKSLDAIHAPIPGYASQLGRSVNGFFDKLKVAQPVCRGNWSVTTSDRLYQPGDSEAMRITSIEEIPKHCFIRTERQTLRRLPKTQAIAFTIKVSIDPISAIASNMPVLNDLLQTLEAMTAAEKIYKSLDRIEPALSRWLLQRINSH